MRRKSVPLLSFFLLAMAWQAGAAYFDRPDLFPPLSSLLKALGTLFFSPVFYRSVSMTIVRGAAGLLFSLGAAAVLAYGCAKQRWLDDLFRPILAILRSVPVISFILFALIFFNPTGIPFVIAFLTMFPLLTENLTKGLRNLRPDLSRMGKQFRIGAWNRGMQIFYPQLKPFLYSGLASSVGFGWRAIIMGEVLAQCTPGIGSEMKRAQSFIDVPDLMAWTIVAVLLSFVFDKGITRLAACKGKIYFHSATAFSSFSSSTIAQSNRPAIRLTKVGYVYGIRHFSFIFRAGKIYGLSAPSGTGKTTLLRLIDGTLTPTRGQVEIDRSRGIASVFEEPALLPHLTAAENVDLVQARFRSAREARKETDCLLTEMGVEADRYPHELSYGQQQRVALARALAFPSPVLLMDEPFKGIDEKLVLNLIEQMRRRQRQNGQTILFVSHSKTELETLSDEIVYLSSDFDS